MDERHRESYANRETVNFSTETPRQGALWELEGARQPPWSPPPRCQEPPPFPEAHQSKTPTGPAKCPQGDKIVPSALGPHVWELKTAA